MVDGDLLIFCFCLLLLIQLFLMCLFALKNFFASSIMDKYCKVLAWLTSPGICSCLEVIETLINKFDSFRQMLGKFKSEGSLIEEKINNVCFEKEILSTSAKTSFFFEKLIFHYSFCE